MTPRANRKSREDVWKATVTLPGRVLVLIRGSSDNCNHHGHNAHRATNTINIDSSDEDCGHDLTTIEVLMLNGIFHSTIYRDHTGMLLRSIPTLTLLVLAPVTSPRPRRQQHSFIHRRISEALIVIELSLHKRLTHLNKWAPHPGKHRPTVWHRSCAGCRSLPRRASRFGNHF